MMLEASTRTFSKCTSKWPPWIASEQRHRGKLVNLKSRKAHLLWLCAKKENNILENRKISAVHGRHNPTILSEHGEGSDELYTWCVHGYQDHTVLAVPKNDYNFKDDLNLVFHNDHFAAAGDNL